MVESVDNDLKIIRIKYDAPEIKHEGLLSTALNRNDILGKHQSNHPLFYTVKKNDARKYPVGRILLVNNAAMFRVAETFPIATYDQVPDTSTLSAQEKKNLASEKGLVYLRLVPMKRDSSADVDVFQFGDKYTSISGSYLKQVIVLNVKEGERVAAGDIIAYNSGFFEPDIDSKQVAWKQGVFANVALLEKSETYEDSCEITKEFGDRLAMAPGHVRVISLTNNTAIQSLVKEGDHVETTDYLCTLEDGDLDSLTSIGDEETMELLASLNRKNPTAKYHGKIAKVEMYHACEYQDLHPSLQKLARSIANRRMAVVKAVAGAKQSDQFPLPQRVPIGTKFQGIDFVDDSVVALVITITEDIGCVPGDKLVLAAQAKTVIGNIVEEPSYTVSGERVDMHFAGSGFANRILQSPPIIGIGNKVLKTLEEEVIKDYFN